jgi:hypothetical protein
MPTPTPAADAGADLDRVARLVADGQIPLPDDLDDADLSRLVDRVSALRRRRLVQFIARAIAADLADDPGPHGNPEP